MGKKSCSMLFKRYRNKIILIEDKDFLRLAKCLVAAKDKRNIDLFRNDREERFIRGYIEYADNASDEGKAHSN